MRSPFLFALAMLVPVIAAAESGSKPVRLKATTAPSLVDCAPVTQVPCMSVGLTPVNDAGQPAPVALPPSGELARSFSLRQGERLVTPFYASAGLGPDAQQHSNVTLLLVDISGSMNQPAPGSSSRFAAVKSAVGQFLGGMQEGTDRIAIVPFESHNVTPTVRSAVYATTRADAMAQLNALPTPANKNNTALYQAVFSGVQSLQDEIGSLERQGRSQAELQPHLVVMTDGRNEVLPGDDPQLLNGDLGLQQAAAQVNASHLDVLGIGFGDRAAIDAAALQRLSTRFVYATDASQLLAALHSSRSTSSHEIQVTWLLPENNRLALMGRDPQWVPELRLAGQPVLTGNAVHITGPATNAPVYARRALSPELQALIAVQPTTDSGWSVVLIYYLLALGTAALLLILWFWVPRLVWGERYLQAIPARNKRWSSERSAVTSASGVQIRSSALPAGFEAAAASGGAVQRSAAQTTQLQPRGELSRTRLTFDQK